MHERRARIRISWCRNVTFQKVDTIQMVLTGSPAVENELKDLINNRDNQSRTTSGSSAAHIVSTTQTPAFDSDAFIRQSETALQPVSACCLLLRQQFKSRNTSRTEATGFTGLFLAARPDPLHSKQQANCDPITSLIEKTVVRENGFQRPCG